jgi:3-oxoacyl-(acyl-carrier-protein) synthase
VLQSERCGLAVGTAYGCLDSMAANSQRVQTKGARLASPLLFMHSFVNAPASLIAIEWGLRGPAATFTDGALSAAAALSWATDLLCRGKVDMMLVGGVETLSEPLLRAVEADPTLAGGVQPLEAAVFFLLERAEVAARRGARPLAEIESASLTALASPGKAPRRPGARKTHAFGAEFALRLAEAVGRPAPAGRWGRGTPPAVTVQEVQGRREGKITVRVVLPAS